MDEHQARISLRMLLFVSFIVAGVILLVYASFSLGVCDGDCHRIFSNELGVPGILAIVVGVVGLSWLSITKWSR